MSHLTDTDLDRVNASDSPAQGDELLHLAGKLLAKLGAPPVPGFSLPEYDYIALTYIGSTNNVQTAVYKSGGSGGTTVATLTFTYVASGAADDDKVATVTKS